MSVTLEHTGFSKMFAEDHLTVGLVFPLESYRGTVPAMENQVELARRVEQLGFAALWFRDVPLNDPNFDDVGAGGHSRAYLGAARRVIERAVPLANENEAVLWSLRMFSRANVSAIQSSGTHHSSCFPGMNSSEGKSTTTYVTTRGC